MAVIWLWPRLLKIKGIYDKHIQTFRVLFQHGTHRLSGTVAIPRLLLKILHFVNMLCRLSTSPTRLLCMSMGGTAGVPALRSPGQKSVKLEVFEFRTGRT